MKPSFNPHFLLKKFSITGCLLPFSLFPKCKASVQRAVHGMRQRPESPIQFHSQKQPKEDTIQLNLPLNFEHLGTEISSRSSIQGWAKVGY